MNSCETSIQNCLPKLKSTIYPTQILTQKTYPVFEISTNQQLSQTEAQKCLNKYWHASSAQNNYIKLQTQGFKTLPPCKERQTALSTKSCKGCPPYPNKINHTSKPSKEAPFKLFKPNVPKAPKMYHSPNYIQLWSKNNLHLLTPSRLEQIHAADANLLQQKINHFIPARAIEFTIHTQTLVHFPYFVSIAESDKNSSRRTMSEILAGDSILHFISSHAGRRLMSRSASFYHLNQPFIDTIFPDGINPTLPFSLPSNIDCVYQCHRFFQSCEWHQNKEYQPHLVMQRRALLEQFEHVIDKPEFWMSLAFEYYSQCSFHPENCDDSLEQSLAFIDNLAKAPVVESFAVQPWWHVTQAAQDASDWCSPHPRQYAQALEVTPEVQEEEKEEEEEEQPDGEVEIRTHEKRYRLTDSVYFRVGSNQMEMERDGMKRKVTCFTCNLVFDYTWQFRKHLQSAEHNKVVRALTHIRDGTTSTLAETYHNVTETLSERIGRARQAIKDQLSSDPIASARDYFSERLENLLQSVSDLHTALPVWIRTHMRFLVNIVCSVVTVIFSKTWIAVLSAITSMINEILHEFPQLLRSKLDSLVECFKQVIRKYFPKGQQAQAQPTKAHDDAAANESFIRSLFGIMSSILPGVTVDSGILKARIQRIQSLAVCLNALKTLGEWCAMLFDKIWSWIQIYWYGATSADLAKIRTLLKHPDIQVWINDIQAFELGRERDGQINPGVTRILTSVEAQETVLDLKKRGEEFLLTLSLSDEIKNHRVTQLVQTYLRKVDKWYQTFEDTKGLAENKHEPFIVYLYGDPGVGKTFCANYLSQALAYAEGRPFNPARDVFAKPRASEYYDGYNNHFCFLLDDFMQVNEPQANAAEVSLIIDAGSRAKFHLDMAALEKKATSYFTSPLIVITSNKQLNKESFEGIVTEYSALARRIDMAIEVRKLDGWVPKSDEFDPSGMFFHATKFRLDKEALDGGVWENLMNPSDWGTLIQTASLLYMRKRQRQKRLDIEHPISDVNARRIDRILAEYLDAPGSDKEVLKTMLAHETKELKVDWRREKVDPKTNRTVQDLIPILGVETTPSLFTGSTVSRNASMEAMNKYVPVDIKPVHPAKSASQPDVRVEMVKVERLPSETNLPGPSYRMEPVELPVTPTSEVGEVTGLIDDGYSHQEPIAEDEVTRASVEIESEVESGQVAQGKLELKNSVISPRQMYRCPVESCSKPFYIQKDTGVEFFQHVMMFAHGVCPRSCDSQGHRELMPEEVKLFESILTPNESRLLSEYEIECYQEIVLEHPNFCPTPSPWSIEQLYAENMYDHVRVLINLYDAHYRKSLAMRMLYRMKRPVDAFCERIASFVSRTGGFIVAPVTAIATIAENALDRIDTIVGRIGTYAIVGLLMTLMGAAIGFSVMRYYNVKHEVVMEAAKQVRFVEPEGYGASASEIVRGKKNVKKIQRTEDGEVEGYGGSATVVARGKQKKRQQVTENNCDSEGYGPSDVELSRGQKKKMMRRTEGGNVCRYVCVRNIAPYALRVQMKRVAPTDDHDLEVVTNRGLVTLIWSAEDRVTVPIQEESSLTDMKICEEIERHYEVPEIVEESEAKEDRLELVKNMIGELPVQVSEAARDCQMTDLCKSIGPSLAIVTNLTRGLTLRGFFPVGTVLMVPRHLFADIEPSECEMNVITNQATYRVRPGKPHPYLVVEDKDTVFIDLKALNVPARRNAVPHFIKSEEDVKANDGMLCVPLPDDKNSYVRYFIWKTVSNLRKIPRVSYTDGSNAGKQIEITRAFGYDGDPEPGDCGSLLFRNELRASTKILGFHVAGSTGEGTATAWTQERLLESLRQLGSQVAQARVIDLVPMKIEPYFGEEQEQDDEGNMRSKVTFVDVIGNIDPAYHPGNTTATKLRKSVLFEKIVPTNSGPSTKRPFVREDGVQIDPLKLALEKLESPQIIFDEKLIVRCAKRMTAVYSKNGWLTPYGSLSHGKLTLSENISGDETDVWIKPLNMKTSPGYPYVLAGNKWLYVNPSDDSIHPILESAMKEREEKARNGEYVPALMVDILKDERLSNEKRAKGKVRIFNVCPLDFNMLVRKYFTRFLAQMMEHHIRGEVSVGINPHGDEWEAFYKTMKHRGDRWLAGDYSAWDKRAPVQIAYALLPMVEEYYAKFEDYEPEDAVVRRILIEQAMRSTRLAMRGNEGLIYQVHQSMPSGVAVTAVMNSLINSLLFRVIFAELGEKCTEYPVAKWINQYDQYVAFAAYGDDHVARVSDCVSGWFNMCTISKKMAEHHITYTSATKGEIEEAFVEDEDLQYLKRKFVYRGSRVDAPMDLMATLDILNWVQAEDRSLQKEASESAIRSVIVELSHHGKKTFDEWYEKILRQAILHGLDVPIITYDEMVNARRKEKFDYDDIFDF